MNKIKKLKARIKLELAFPDYRKILLDLNQSSKKKWLLLGSPIHDNLGDHLITLAELNYLRNLSFDVNIFEIPTEMLLLYHQIIKDSINLNDIIFINGGGWMGTLWKHDESFMQQILHTFKDNKIIVFPQTIYYDDYDTELSDVLASAKAAWKSAPNAILCLRDECSYQYALNTLEIEKERCLLLPDVALLYHADQSFVQRDNKILMCLRSDKEQIVSFDVRMEIEHFIHAMNYDCVYTSTLTKKVVSLKERRELVNKKINEFASAKLIITDRLHGMIFAFLANTPCIALDNKTKKVFGVYKAWLSEVNTIQYSIAQTDALKKLFVEMPTVKDMDTETLQIFFKNKYDILERLITDEY